jgi:hypothetical protein
MSSTDAAGNLYAITGNGPARQGHEHTEMPCKLSLPDTMRGHDRRHFRDFNVTEPWAFGDCDGAAGEEAEHPGRRFS